MIPDDHGLDVLIPLVPVVLAWVIYKLRPKKKTQVQRLLRGRDKL